MLKRGLTPPPKALRFLKRSLEKLTFTSIFYLMLITNKYFKNQTVPFLDFVSHCWGLSVMIFKVLSSFEGGELGLLVADWILFSTLHIPSHWGNVSQKKGLVYYWALFAIGGYSSKGGGPFCKHQNQNHFSQAGFPLWFQTHVRCSPVDLETNHQLL